MAGGGFIIGPSFFGVINCKPASLNLSMCFSLNPFQQVRYPWDMGPSITTKSMGSFPNTVKIFRPVATDETDCKSVAAFFFIMKEMPKLSPYSERNG